VTPGSLYLAQLKERLGTEALHNIGYADVNGAPFSRCDRSQSNAVPKREHEGECDDDRCGLWLARRLELRSRLQNHVEWRLGRTP
jgi:hypothetical protein